MGSGGNSTPSYVGLPSGRWRRRWGGFGSARLLGIAHVRRLCVRDLRELCELDELGRCGRTGTACVSPICESVVGDSYVGRR